MTRVTFELTDGIRRRLVEDPIAWLTTVSSRGRRSPRPVWFLWTGDCCVIYSQPGTAKLTHIAANDQVSLHFNADLLVRLGMSSEHFVDTYTVPLRVVPERAWVIDA